MSGEPNSSELSAQAASGPADRELDAEAQRRREDERAGDAAPGGEQPAASEERSAPGQEAGEPTESPLAEDAARPEGVGETAPTELGEDAGESAAEPEPSGEVEEAQPLEEAEEVQPLEEDLDEPAAEDQLSNDWYILKVQVNREDSIRDALLRRIKIAGLDEYFQQIVVPTEDVVEFSKSGKRRTVKRKLYPGYIMVNMTINDDTWFLVRETPGIGDFTGSAGKPTPMDPREVERIIRPEGEEEAERGPTIAIPFKPGDRVRVKEGYFQNFEGDVETIDEANGRVTVMINIFGRSTPVELEHWQIESV